MAVSNSGMALYTDNNTQQSWTRAVTAPVNIATTDVTNIINQINSIITDSLGDTSSEDVVTKLTAIKDAITPLATKSDVINASQL